MHILIVSRGFPDERNPLYGVFEFDQAKALTKIGLHITYFAVNLQSIRHKRKPGICSGEKDGIRWYEINVPVGRISMGVRHRIGLWALRKLYHKVFNKSKPDIIHAHFTEPGYIAAKLAEEEHIPLVITEHSSEMNKAEIDPALLMCARKAYAGADAIIAVGNSLANNVYIQTGHICTVIPNIINNQDFFQNMQHAKPEGFGFIFTGNLIERKRPFLLLEAFQIVHEKYPDTKLGIIGDGVLKPELEQQADNLKLGNLVKFYGRLTREQISKTYGKYDCFVLPSANETFGVVYIEAIAAGLPVIATICGGPEDFVTPEVGLLIPVDDKDALVSAMEHMITFANNYDRKMMKNYILNQFSEQVVAERISSLYLKVIEKRRNETAN